MIEAFDHLEKKPLDYVEHFHWKYFKYTFFPCFLIGIFARSLLLHHQKFQLVLVEMAGSLKKRIVRWEGDMRRDAREVAIFSSSDLRENADGLLPPRWKKQDERCKNLCYFGIIQRELLKSSDWFISFCCPRWTCYKLRVHLNWRNTG